MPVTVRFDPFATVIAAFEALHPDPSCEAVFAVDVAHTVGCGYTVFPDNGLP